MTNKHNSATTTYYLILKKKYEEGFQSFADMNSSKFDTNLLKKRYSIKSVKHHDRNRSSIDKFLEI